MSRLKMLEERRKRQQEALKKKLQEEHNRRVKECLEFWFDNRGEKR